MKAPSVDAEAGLFRVREDSVTLANHRPQLERPKTKARVLALVLEGKSDAQVAAVVGVSRQAITAFRHRHVEDLAASEQKVNDAIVDFAIANKVNRIADAQLRRDLLLAVKEARAAGGEGMETGIVVREYKMVGTGKNAELVEQFKVDTAFLAEWRANDRHVAEELGQMPKASSDININADKLLLVRYIEGPA